MAVKFSYEKCLAKMRGTAPARTTATPQTQTRQHPVDARPVPHRGAQVPHDYADGDPVPAPRAPRAAAAVDDGGSMHAPAPRPPARAVAAEQGRATMRQAAIQQQRPAAVDDMPSALRDDDEDGLPFNRGA
jgi:hypothetical protein